MLGVPQHVGSSNHFPPPRFFPTDRPSHRAIINSSQQICFVTSNERSQTSHPFEFPRCWWNAFHGHSVSAGGYSLPFFLSVDPSQSRRFHAEEMKTLRNNHLVCPQRDMWVGGSLYVLFLLLSEFEVHVFINPHLTYPGLPLCLNTVSEWGWS